MLTRNVLGGKPQQNSKRETDLPADKLTTKLTRRLWLGYLIKKQGPKNVKWTLGFYPIRGASSAGEPSHIANGLWALLLTCPLIVPASGVFPVAPDSANVTAWT
ncbi:hypothetical protein N7509_001884 [Penicillium cosmopolitanum]|uniref:Uncharacterized protein n=1 Tax=Penicillium cosmopolitanum TaxID=1131564 RepID=A0A9X0BCV3_9EURO|nr:uncharacterized protein N7509_001884 [Penicillium cosmopolitanum]KAJ5408001.1 hypothetical protein N7509_001884 [Penicillium cosmopolitanum]